MYTNRVNVFHVADSNTVSCTVTHYFVFDFFPSRDTTFYKNFSYTGKSETILEDFSQFVFVISDTTATSTKCVSRTENDRISYLFSKSHTIFYCCYDFRSSNRLTDFFHGVFEFLTVFSLLDRLCCGTDQAHIMFFEKTFFFQFHCKVQTCLATQCRQYAVRFFFKDQLFYNLYSKRLNINFICNVFVCHDRSRVGVQKNNFHAFFFQRTACLCTSVVKLCCLADDNRTGSNYKNFMYIFISRHDLFLPSFP